MKISLNLIVFLFFLNLSGCGRDSAYVLGPKQWKDISVFVEIRPTPPIVGMNEFLVVATHTDGKPAYEYVVSVKTSQMTEWVQAIQDGHSGIYRRAVRIDDTRSDELEVMFKAQNGAGHLVFPIVDDAVSH